jgi:putative MATE family efflux protein
MSEETQNISSEEPSSSNAREHNNYFEAPQTSSNKKRGPIGSFFSLLRESFRSEGHDFTQGSIARAAILLAIPMILEMSLESVFAVVDMLVVGRQLGERAVAVVGLTEAMITIVYSIAIGLSAASTAIVARRIGEKNPEAATRAGAQAINMSLVATIIISIVGIIFAEDLLRLMEASEKMIVEGAVFTRIMLGGSIVIILLFLINGIFRGAGDAAMAMKSLWIASITNIILCPTFVFMGFGLKGAATATVIGRGLGVTYQCYHLFFGNRILKFKLSDFRLNFELIKSIVKIATPATIQFFIASGSWVVLTRLVAETGHESASSGYTIAIRNIVFFILPAWGISNAAATLVGQNLGAKQIDRAERSVMLCAKYNLIFMSLVALLFIVLAEPIVAFYNDDPKVQYYAATALRIVGCGFPFYGIGMVMTQSLNGAGDTRTPTVINFICFWMCQIPLAYTLALGTGLKTTGVFIAIPVAESLIALFGFYMFKRGGWKKVKV